MDGIRSALIVASEDYTDPGLRRLRAPASDARALAAVLQDPAIGGFEVRTLLNKPAHEVNLAVEEFFADRRPSDLLLVHFSCHGVKDEDGELYFAAPNTILGRLGATAVSAGFVSRQMNRSRSRRVVLLLDCCYAGAFERGLVARAGVEMGIGQHFGGRGRAVITASNAMEYAFEAGELANSRVVPPSVFTSALVEGLATGEADRDQDGLVGLDELYDYVYDKVRAATPNQTPGKWTFGMEGELYIARRSRPITTPAPLPPELEQAIESPLAGIRGGAVQELARILRGRHMGMALAAQLALEQLTDDDSRAVAAAATAALGAPEPAVPSAPLQPELALSATDIDLGRFPQHGQSPERRIRIGNAGGGDLNARAATSAAWLKLRQAGDELVVAADTGAAGEYEGTVTVDSDGGRATIRVYAQVDPMPLHASEAAATAHPEPVPEPAAGAQSGLQEDPVLAMASSATSDEIPPVTTPPPRNDHPPVAAGRQGPGAGEKAPRALPPSRANRGIWRPPMIIAAAAAIAVTGLVIAITIIPGTPGRSGTSGTPGTSSTAGQTVPTANLPVLQKIGKGEDQLNLIAWEGYLDPKWVKPFEQQTGCQVNAKYAGSSDEMIALMKNGGGGQYDMVSSSGDADLRILYAGDAHPVNINLIPSWKDFYPAFQSPAFNTINGVHYGVSLQWGPNVLMYNTKDFPAAPTSWSVIYDQKHKGHVTVPDNPIQIADAALYLKTHKPELKITDPYELTQPQFQAAVTLLASQRPLIEKYWSLASQEIFDFKNGNATVGAGWPYQVSTLKAAHFSIGTVIPSEGSTGWADTWMLAAKAPHPNCAYMWMRYISTPQVQAEQAVTYGETPDNKLACAYMNKLQAGSCEEYHANVPQSYFDSISLWKTPIATCDNGQNDCVPYAQWVSAWNTQVK